jgi:FtsP/CotA-like multicopper oxidase with cupredoxin domain
LVTDFAENRRSFLKNAGLSAGALLLAPEKVLLRAAEFAQVETPAPEYKIHICNAVAEIARKRFVSTVTYNGQFPGPLLRFKEGQPVTVAIFNDTDTPEQLHWHGQKVSVDLDGAAEEGTPFIPPHGQRVITFTPGPAGLRFYHTQHFHFHFPQATHVKLTQTQLAFDPRMAKFHDSSAPTVT